MYSMWLGFVVCHSLVVFFGHVVIYFGVSRVVIWSLGIYATTTQGPYDLRRSEFFDDRFYLIGSVKVSHNLTNL